MFTIASYLCCCDNDSDSDIDSYQRPLLDGSDSGSESSMAPRTIRTYGRRKVNTTSTLFTAASPIPIPPRRNPLADVTAQLSNLTIQIPEGSHTNSDANSGQSDDVSIHSNTNTSQAFILSIASTSSSDDSTSHEPSPDDIALEPLTQTYEADRGVKLPITPWDALIPQGATVEKIAEASFAEVYRVSLNGQSSILKIMQLKIPSDKLSAKCKTAIDPQTVASEVRLMNTLTELPGFVTFKEAHLAKGKPCNAVIRAYTSCMTWSPANGTSSFPNPAFFQPEALFLVVELGDAGTVLEDVQMENIDQVWDVFLGVVVSMGIAEKAFEFEHRDLHENNICVKFGEPKLVKSPSRKQRYEPSSAFGPRKPVRDPSSRQKYGFSGISTTIIDYGLSRAKVENGDEVFNDLESDLAIFHGSSGYSQFDTYRRMRNHLFSGQRKMLPRSWHNEHSKTLNNGHTWREYIPYTNVLWIKYLLNYLKKNLQLQRNEGDAEDLKDFEEDTAELKRRLDPRTLAKNGAFSSANGVCEYFGEMGWITEEQVAAMSDG